MKSLIATIFVGMCFAIVGTKRIPTFAGPYRVLITHIRNFSDEVTPQGKSWLSLRTTQARGKQPQYGWGYAYTNFVLDDDTKVDVEMALWSNNEWKRNAFVFHLGRTCSRVFEHCPALLDLLYGRPQDQLKCPIHPVGLREIKNHSFELLFPKIPVLPYGRYRYTMTMSKGTEIKAIGEADSTLVPRL